LFLKPDVLVEQAQLPFHVVSGIVIDCRLSDVAQP
jgi:hypothetical protein